MMFPFRKDGDEKKEEVKTEVYKGCWEYDAREGFGICYYGDGSRYVGAWKENKRHGYGLLIFKDGKKSGGKWYNDNLLLMTRRKNLRLPMIRKKINRTVLAAIDAAEKGNNKMKLAISRGLSAKKIAESAKDVAALAERNAQQAMECRKKYTLHPCLQGKLDHVCCFSAMFSNIFFHPNSFRFFYDYDSPVESNICVVSIFCRVTTTFLYPKIKSALKE